ncbi:FapA family protein [Maridesulfovibrio zosterae]|uniref:FapA family protein n=1 Tax=Maridesulfovibrio zosterae TaxID=82171 RepID=UPI0003FEC36C|nr:FapA family protein [Maridesulfovibrio zosterae]
MPCLKHYFDPDFDYQNLKPVEKNDGSVDYYNMGYVQSVIKDQVLAQWEDEPEDGCPMGYRHFPEKKFPKGPNTKVNPEDINQLIATRNGYVFYNEDGLIMVKELLNVRGDVSLSTGNIFFVGDIIVHGSIKSGLDVKANNINVKRHIEQANVQAAGFLKCDGGIKGNSKALIQSKETLRTAFCENATLVSEGNIIIEKNCMHTKVYCEGKFAVKGRFAGGKCYSDQYVYIGEQLGGGLSTPSQIVAGYNPIYLLQIDKISDQVKSLTDTVETLQKVINNGHSTPSEYIEKIEKNEMKIRFLKNKKKKLWTKIQQAEKLECCRIMVEGIVKPGVEISIGQAFMQVDSPLENVFFYYENNEIKVGSPALKK